MSILNIPKPGGGKQKRTPLVHYSRRPQQNLILTALNAHRGCSLIRYTINYSTGSHLTEPGQSEAVVLV